jgi:pseudouridylate synthase
MNNELQRLAHFSEEAATALREGLPLVALESTVIAHGLPRPLNVETALEMEAAVCGGGATPATIAVLDGRVHIGLTREELERVGAGEGVGKASLRDLPILLARGASGGTTVSATAHLAAQVGIKVFATGGIGGVHRGWGETLDISADLPALADTPIVTVCAGAKSVLDLAATLEWLESHGVTVLGYRTHNFPAFYSPSTEPPLPVDARVDEAREVAEIMKMRATLGLPGGVLLCVPPPAETSIPHADVEVAIRDALAEAEAAGTRGRDVTPALLSALSRATRGRSLAANRALLLNNARVAAEVARAVSPGRFAWDSLAPGT